MIGSIEGVVQKKRAKDIVVVVGGVGYRITVGELFHHAIVEGEPVSLVTYLVVREDALTLFGFRTEEEFSLFETLLSVSGIGPKSAMTIVSGGDPSAMKHAIALGDTAYLSKVSGVGKKSAEKIVLELREKFRDLKLGESVYAGKDEREALEALESLGYAIRDIRDAVHAEAQKGKDAKAIIAYALKTLGKT